MPGETTQTHFLSFIHSMQPTKTLIKKVHVFTPIPEVPLEILRKAEQPFRFYTPPSPLIIPIMLAKWWLRDEWERRGLIGRAKGVSAWYRFHWQLSTLSIPLFS